MKRLYVSFLAAFALALLALGWGVRESATEAVEPDLEFEMEVLGGTPVSGGGCTTVGTAPTQKGDAICSLPTGSFTVGVQLTNPGETSGQITTWQAVIAWSSGLAGPGDAGSPKALGFRAGHGCLGIEASSAPWLAQPRTAGVGCVASPGPFTDAEATSFVAEFELTCGQTPSQEQVTMLVTPHPNIDQSTFLEAIFFDNPFPFADKDGSEVITIECEGQPVGGIARLPPLADTASDTSGGSGPGIHGRAPAVFGMSVAALVLIGAAWFARWRWSR